MSMGNLRIERDDAGEAIHGRIASLRYDVAFSFVPTGASENRDRAGQGDYRIMGRTPAGSACQIGRAWRNEGKTGNNAGKVNFRLWLEDESFGDGLGLTAFPDGSEPGLFRLVRETKREGGQ